MAATITPEDVYEYYPPAEQLPKSVVECYIEIVNKADDCFDANPEYYTDCVVKMIKLNAVAWFCQNSSSGGRQTDSERAHTGEAYTYSDYGKGLDSNEYGRQVKTLDLYGCLTGQLEAPQNDRFFVSVGGR